MHSSARKQLSYIGTQIRISVLISTNKKHKIGDLEYPATELTSDANAWLHGYLVETL